MNIQVEGATPSQLFVCRYEGVSSKRGLPAATAGRLLSKFDAQKTAQDSATALDYSSSPTPSRLLNILPCAAATTFAR